MTIVCDRTSYTTELEFKLKPFLGGQDAMNAVHGKIKLGRETMADLEGHWDGSVYLTDRTTGVRPSLPPSTPSSALSGIIARCFRRRNCSGSRLRRQSRGDCSATKFPWSTRRTLNPRGESLPGRRASRWSPLPVLECGGM